MCRAYIPHKCYTFGKNGERVEYDSNNELHRKYSHLYTWYHDEDDKEWHAVDLHAQTAINAFGESIKDSPNFKKYRKYGKIVNFCSNYGGGFGALRANPACRDLTDAQIKSLHEAYGKTFPKVKAYQEVVQKTINKRGYVENEFGRRYYIKDPRYGYKCANYLIQGTCADSVKEVQIKLYKFLKENNYKSRMVISIHDELVIEVADGEEHIIRNVLDIMADQPWSHIPFIAEPEMFSTRWSEKAEVEV